MKAVNSSLNIREKKREKERGNKKKEKRKNSLTSVKNKLRKILHLFVRLEEAYKVKGAWMNRCVTCGEEILFSRSQAGHFFASGPFPPTRFERSNIHAQCIRCNKFNHGNLIEYYRWMQNNYGETYISCLRERAYGIKLKPYRETRDDLQRDLEVWSQRLDRLIASKGFVKEDPGDRNI